MTDIRYYHLSETHRCAVELRDDDIFIWIEENRKFLWFTYYSKVSSAYMFAFTDSEPKGEFPQPCGISITTRIKGRLETMERKLRYTGTFNLKSESDTLYSDYLKSIREAKTRQKQVNNIINSL